MEYRQLGSSGLRVSALSMGTVLFGGGFPEMGSLELSDARTHVEIALDAGVNLFDTADGYGKGASEEMLGRVLEGRRDNVLIATKVFVPMGDGPNDCGLSRKHLLRACEESLRRLRTDYIDLYQMHGWDGQTSLEETMAVLDCLVRSGKVRYVGVSNYSGWQLMKAIAISERKGLARFASEQIYYSLQAREAEYELVPIAVDQGIGVIVWSPLAGGLLTGKWRRGVTEPAVSRRVTGWPDPPVYDQKRLWDTIDVILRVADDHGATPAQVALAYILDKPGISSVVVGARTTEQLRDNLKATDLKLTADLREALDDVSAPRLIYPYWWQAKYDNRLGPADLTLLGRYLAEEPVNGIGPREPCDLGDVRVATGREGAPSPGPLSQGTR